VSFSTGLLTLGPWLAWARPGSIVRTALADLLAQMLALLGRHLAPALRVFLEALALLGIHGLIALEAPLELLLSLRGQLLEALVRRLELTLAVLGQAVPPLEVLHDARALAGGMFRRRWRFCRAACRSPGVRVFQC